ncbi:hypothetical protein B0H13DRAFT_1894239 [Mycena leptocephala]|nr:hypothetical protein B0H13DRAFT_1894239 [Mycena leptocephala]
MKPGTSQISELLEDNDLDIRFSATNVFGKLADHLVAAVLHGFMMPGVPQIIVFGKLADHPVFHESMTPGISQITELLEDSDDDIHQSAADAFQKLAPHRIWNELCG